MNKVQSRREKIPTYVKESTKVIGYFSYSGGNVVFCDGDACIIADSEERMRLYLKMISTVEARDIIKKTRFGEIMNGLKRGGAYAFDRESYCRFFDLVKLNGLEGLPEKESFSNNGETSEMHFIRIQIA